MSVVPIFTQKDFEVFHIPGLEPRMKAIKSTVRPKLEGLGQLLSPTLSSLVGDEMFYHVAKHARRTVNPPDDTWVAWSTDKRGYKKHPHFQVGLWSSHLYARIAIIYHSPNKPILGKHLVEQAGKIMQLTPGHFTWSVDHLQPQTVLHKSMRQDELIEMGERLRKVKKAELLCGIEIPNNDKLLANSEELLSTMEKAFETLMPLYRLSF